MKGRGFWFWFFYFLILGWLLGNVSSGVGLEFGWGKTDEYDGKTDEFDGKTDEEPPINEKIELFEA